jgi:hypothetical protein
MESDLDTSQLSPAALKAIDPKTPLPLRMMAAKGIVPGAKPADSLIVLAVLARAEDTQVASTAKTTLASLPKPLLDGALGGTLHGGILHVLVEHSYDKPELVERILRQPELSGASLELLAERATERIGELIATNEQRMLANPRVIQRLYLNKQVRMSTADRLIELAVRNGIEVDIPAFKEAAAAIKNELIAEPTPEPTYDDILFAETDRIAESLPPPGEGDDTHEATEEGEEVLKDQYVPLYQQIAQMTVTQKIRRAMLGSSAERLLLVRDANRLVAAAVAKSPLLRENEAVLITSSRAMSDEVLRIIAMNREFTRNYQIKYNLVTNPRTPFSFVSRLIPHLREADLKNLLRSKNVTSSVVQAIRQQLQRKTQG